MIKKEGNVYNVYEEQIKEFANLKFQCPKCKGYYPHYYKGVYIEFGQEICYECGLHDWYLEKEPHMLNPGEWDIIDEVMLMLLNGQYQTYMTRPQKRAYALIKRNKKLIPGWFELVKKRGTLCRSLKTKDLISS